MIGFRSILLILHPLLNKHYRLNIMKRLILVRHAKAEIADYEKTDVQRKLIQRGINDAGLMANMINENIPMPSLIVSSNAVRAYQTACIIGEKIGYNVCSIKKIPDFYENVSASDILTFANNEPRCSDSLMVVGHNPWITYVAQHLASYNFV